MALHRLIQRLLNRSKRAQSSRSKGEWAEGLAASYLQQQGLTLLRKNYFGRRGEIDLIMLDGQQLVFVEVRYRRQSNYGSAVASVDWRKQQKLIKTAQQFLLQEPQHRHRCCRFDVLGLTGSGDSTATVTTTGSTTGTITGTGTSTHYNWIKRAFTL